MKKTLASLLLFAISTTAFAAPSATTAVDTIKWLLAKHQYVGSFTNGKECLVTIGQSSGSGAVSVVMQVKATGNIVATFQMSGKSQLASYDYENDGDAIYTSVQISDKVESERSGPWVDQSVLTVSELTDDGSMTIEITSTDGKKATCSTSAD